MLLSSSVNNQIDFQKSVQLIDCHYADKDKADFFFFFNSHFPSYYLAFMQALAGSVFTLKQNKCTGDRAVFNFER